MQRFLTVSTAFWLCKNQLVAAISNESIVTTRSQGHIDIVSYGLAVPVILSALPLLRPGYDMGLEMLRSTYHLNASLTYLSSPDAKSCADLPDHLDLVIEYYYRKQASGSTVVLILPGTCSLAANNLVDDRNLTLCYIGASCGVSHWPYIRIQRMHIHFIASISPQWSPWTWRYA